MKFGKYFAGGAATISANVALLPAPQLQKCGNTDAKKLSRVSHVPKPQKCHPLY
jgi:hypothetical protein